MRDGMLMFGNNVWSGLYLKVRMITGYFITGVVVVRMTNGENCAFSTRWMICEKTVFAGLPPD